MTSSVSLAGLPPPDLPDGREAVAEGKAMGRKLEIAPSLYLQEKGVGSERAWRERAAAEGISSTCINIGLATWPDTREALGCIYEDSLRRGVRPPDRFNILAERRMGLPKALRLSAPQETGPLLMTQEDWWETTHTVPIQPEAADNTIGGPGSLDNAVDAIQAGITHIGVLSQYMWRWPYWEDETQQVMAVLKAAGVLAAHRRAGVCFDSYLEDGYPGVFHDYANYIGWAMLERYVSEDLIGAAYSCSWGGLTTDPVTKAAVTLALHAFRPEHVPAGFIQGDTIGNRADFEANAGVVSTDVLFMKAVDFRYRLGGAPIAVPVTEMERIPTWQEVAQVHAINRRLEEYLPSVAGAIDWSLIEAKRDALVEGGRRFFDAAITTMRSSGIDVQDPAAVLVVIKRLGASACEELFGAGAQDDAYPRGRRPVLETDLVHQTMAERGHLLDLLRSSADAGLGGLRLVLASTDVHEFAKFLLDAALAEAGGRVIDAGVNRDPEDIVSVAVESAADAIVITTHNGVARSFAQVLRRELEAARLGDLPVFMGGVLNEDVEGSEIPVDVRADLRDLGVQPLATVEELIGQLARLASVSRDAST
ncbi:MAG TPA: cobalamin-dependent protein [Streptosporangiaceae bacterium]|nr:cobalamin-dependent protein [Streptosporangiaceae bacterium]